MADIICERCKKRPAKNFICQIIGDEQRNLSLCEECYRADQALSSDAPVFDGTERCYYCGAPAKSGAKNDDAEHRARGQRFHFTCVRCAQLYAQFLMVALADIPSEASSETENEVAARWIRQIDTQVFECVRQPQT